MRVIWSNKDTIRDKCVSDILLVVQVKKRSLSSRPKGEICQEAGHTLVTSLMLIFWVSPNIHALIWKNFLEQKCSFIVSTSCVLFQLDWKKYLLSRTETPFLLLFSSSPISLYNVCSDAACWRDGWIHDWRNGYLWKQAFQNFLQS